MEAAARRGEKGFSRLVEEAVESYLDALDERRQKARAALATFGRLTESEAGDLEAAMRTSRTTWRSR